MLRSSGYVYPIDSRERLEVPELADGAHSAAHDTLFRAVRWFCVKVF